VFFQTQEKVYINMRRSMNNPFFLTSLFSVLCLAPCTQREKLEAADQPRYLLPPTSETQPEPETPPESTQKTPTPSRSTYESLTEERGTLKLRKDIRERKEQEQKDREERERAARNADLPTPPPASVSKPTSSVERKQTPEGPIINFNNVNITEVLKYVSRLTGKNFVYDPQELQYTLTTISETPNTVEAVLAMVVQSLRAHGYSVLEEGEAFLIHTNPSVRSVGGLEDPKKGIEGPQIATQVFVLQNIASDQCALIVKTMVTDGAIVEALGDSTIVVSDVLDNLMRIGDIIKKMDSPIGGLEIGQYVAINSSPGTLVALAERIIAPLAANKPLVLVPHTSSNSVFIVSTPFLIEKCLSIMQSIDLNLTQSGILERLKFDPAAAERARREHEQEATGKEQKELENLTEQELRRRLLDAGVQASSIDNMTISAAREALRSVQKRRFAESGLPIGTVEATQFLIFRLQYRKSSDIATALKAIATSLASGVQAGGSPTGAPVNPEISQSDLIITLNSLQPVDDNNTIVFTGTAASLEKIKALLAQLDIPVRQVFIEALILDTTLTNSLQFSVEWAAKMQRRNLAAQTGFLNPTAPAFSNAFNAVQQYTPVQLSPPPAPGGLSAGGLGRKIKFMGKGFRSTGALIQALQSDEETHIIFNPKIMTEHNIPAEVFVGAQTPIKGQSIANATTGSTSSIVATNYNTVETGVSLKVTPLISSKETVTLIIEQKVSNANTQQVAQQGQTTAPPATVNETRTVTRVHMPTDHFLVLSGLILEEQDITSNRIPCLGSLPIVGNLFGAKVQAQQKRNLMIFIRPIIIDTEQDVDEITKRQEQNMKDKSRVNEQGWAKEIDDLKAILNIEPNTFP
jgi:type III secretion protein C